MKKSLLKSFRHAFSGLFYTIMNEKNFRIHIIAIVYTMTFSILYGLERVEYVILILIFVLVLITEIINTSIESSINLKVAVFDKYAKIAKDTAAAAVLITAAAAVATAVVLFSDVEKLMNVFSVITSLPGLPIFLCSLPFAFLFIFGIKEVKNKSDKK